MEPNETPMGPEELRPEPQKSKKKVLPYVVCCLATAVVVFALTFAGMTLLQSRQKSTSDDDYLAKVQEVVALLFAGLLCLSPAIFSAAIFWRSVWPVWRPACLRLPCRGSILRHGGRCHARRGRPMAV